MKRQRVRVASRPHMMTFSLFILSATFWGSVTLAEEKSSLPDWSEIRAVKLQGDLNPSFFFECLSC